MAEDVKLLVSNTHAFFGVLSQEGRDATTFHEAFNREVQETKNAVHKPSPSVSTSCVGRSSFLDHFKF